MWPIKLEESQRQSRATIVLITDPSASGPYYLDEIKRATDLNRIRGVQHGVYPVLLSGSHQNLPYGLGPFQAMDASQGGLRFVADRLVTQLRQPGRRSWEDYNGLLKVGEYRVAYLSLLNADAQAVAELDLSDITVALDRHPFHLPSIFRRSRAARGFSDEPCCRLSSYDRQAVDKLHLTFAETTYGDYLTSGEHLDDPMPGGGVRTLRDEVADLVHEGRHNLRDLTLTNISGVGVFIITQDNRLIISQHSKKSHVYPGRYTFSSSGVMKWGAYPNPFVEVIRKCYEEAHHQINPGSLRLLGFGADARKLYFQFSFLERTEEQSALVLARAPQEHHLESIPLELEPIIEHVLDNCWEPAAEATLFTLSSQLLGGRQRIEDELLKREAQWARKQMVDEWDYRANRPGLLPVMSVRYPEAQRKRTSQQYVRLVMRFIGSDIVDRRVLEVGCGVGRITEQLLKKAKYVKAIDLCDRMLEKAWERVPRVATLHARVEFERWFAQDFRSGKRYDVSICSLVLIHNVADVEFAAVISAMCRYSNTVFVFEDITPRRATSPHTRLRTKEELERQFSLNGFSLENEKEIALVHDRIAFMKFSRDHQR